MKRKRKEKKSIYSTGIVRPLDRLGRIVLPIDIRRGLKLCKDSKLEILIDGNSIILQKLEIMCSLCGQKTSELHSFKKAMLCAGCLKTVK